MKNTFSVIFYLTRQAVKKDGTVPVMWRITVDGTQAQFSSKLSVKSKLWNTKGGHVTGRSSAALISSRLQAPARVPEYPLPCERYCPEGNYSGIYLRFWNVSPHGQALLYQYGLALCVSVSNNDGWHATRSVNMKSRKRKREESFSRKRKSVCWWTTNKETPNGSFTVTCICSVHSRGCRSQICAICERKISIHTLTTMSGKTSTSRRQVWNRISAYWICLEE